MTVDDVTLVPAATRNAYNVGVGMTFTRKAGVLVSGIDSISIIYKFYKHGTTKAASVKGYGQIFDIDCQQGVRFGAGIKHVVYNNYATEKGKLTTKKVTVSSGNWISGCSYWMGNAQVPASKQYKEQKTSLSYLQYQKTGALIPVFSLPSQLLY